MTTSTLVGTMAIRPRIEPAESDGVIAIREFDVPAGSSLPVAHSHDAYGATICRGLPQWRCVWERTSGGQLRCVWV